jgi:hypothetical protein
MNVKQTPTVPAKDFPGKIKVGSDNNRYISKKNNNDVYKWVKLTNSKTPEEYWSQFKKTKREKYKEPVRSKIKELTSELLKNNIILYYSKWKESVNIIDIDDIVHNYMTKKFGNINDISYIFYTENGLYKAKRDGLLKLYHLISEKDNKKVTEIFNNVIGSDYEWSGKPDDNIIIKLHKK